MLGIGYSGEQDLDFTTTRFINIVMISCNTPAGQIYISKFGREIWTQAGIIVGEKGQQRDY